MPESEVKRLTSSSSADTNAEDAVRSSLFHETVDEVRQAFASVPAEEVESIIGEAVESVRKDKQR